MKKLFLLALFLGACAFEPSQEDRAYDLNIGEGHQHHYIGPCKVWNDGKFVIHNYYCKGCGLDDLPNSSDKRVFFELHIHIRSKRCHLINSCSVNIL